MNVRREASPGSLGSAVQLIGSGLFTTELVVRATACCEPVDITDDIERLIDASGVRNGLAHIFCKHTTCGVLINEFEDGLAEDLKRAMELLVPYGYFAHDDLTRRTQNLQGPDEPPNGAAHIRQMLFGATSQSVPVADGSLGLGTWQRVQFLELDDPRPRTLFITVMGSP
jgi:secondary thiamine-phosphate synthase enzyme